MILMVGQTKFAAILSVPESCRRLQVPVPDYRQLMVRMVQENPT
jgi:hypothetical protein